MHATSHLFPLRAFLCCILLMWSVLLVLHLGIFWMTKSSCESASTNVMLIAAHVCTMWSSNAFSYLTFLLRCLVLRRATLSLPIWSTAWSPTFLMFCPILGKPVASICHGPWLLVSAKVLTDKRVTCFHSIKDDVINAGWVSLRDRWWCH